MDLFLDFRFNLLFWTHPNQLHSWWTLANWLFLTLIQCHFPPLCNQVACLILFQNWKEISIDTFCHNIEKSMTYLAWPPMNLWLIITMVQKHFKLFCPGVITVCFLLLNCPSIPPSADLKLKPDSLRSSIKKQMVSLSIKRCTNPYVTLQGLSFSNQIQLFLRFKYVYRKKQQITDCLMTFCSRLTLYSISALLSPLNPCCSF